ncbi:MAG: SCP2 sterol-binding domain-containing protein [Deltaproteobacteria bacterium]|nr:SCP2 sterol-binding domain-containing protein [Deltaproteobacteria bacterium]
MADQPEVPSDVTAAQFFEVMLPMGFEANAAANPGQTPRELTMQYVVTGDGGGDWTLSIKDGKLTAAKGRVEAANVTFTVSVDDWRDAVLGQNGASLALILPQPRPGRPDNSGRLKEVKGTMALELSREAQDPYKVEMCFNNAAAPRTLLRMKLAEWTDMQTGKLNGQEAFMQGRIKVEGDMGFLMQIAMMAM